VDLQKITTVGFCVVVAVVAGAHLYALLFIAGLINSKGERESAAKVIDPSRKKGKDVEEASSSLPRSA
jgi:hypothetical protein